MPFWPALRAELTPHAIAWNVTKRHDDARVRFHLNTNDVADYDEFSRLIGEYYNYLFACCISDGARLPPADALGRAQEILARGRRGEGRADVQAFYDVRSGLAGGLQGVLDQITEGLKTEAVDRHVRAVLDRHVKPYSTAEKISIVSQILAELEPPAVPPSTNDITLSNPEEYAAAYERIVRVIMRNMQHAYSAVRGM